MSKVKHVVVSGRGGKLTMKCNHCGQKEEQEMPVSVDALDRLGNIFISKHTACKPKKTGKG